MKNAKATNQISNLTEKYNFIIHVIDIIWKVDKYFFNAERQLHYKFQS